MRGREGLREKSGGGLERREKILAGTSRIRIRNCKQMSRADDRMQSCRERLNPLRERISCGKFLRRVLTFSAIIAKFKSADSYESRRMLF